ncbi:MAG: c-type cytochrome [Alphaproteobacteria bacterium]
MRTVFAAIVFSVLAGSAHAMTYDEKLAGCLACHGEKGISENPEVPSLAGMPADFTLIQLFMFRQGTRKVEIMNDLAKDMSDDDLRNFSAYFAKLPPPKASGEAPNPEIAARAQAAIAANHCASCHNPDFSGRDQMPRLAAQREDYLLKALRDYKTAQRPGYDATMDEVIRPVTDQNIVDLAHYLARFK